METTGAGNLDAIALLVHLSFLSSVRVGLDPTHRLLSPAQRVAAATAGFVSLWLYYQKKGASLSSENPPERHPGWLPPSLMMLTPHCGQEGAAEKSLTTSVRGIVGMDQSPVVNTAEMVVTCTAILIMFIHLSMFLKPSILNSFFFFF